MTKKTKTVQQVEVGDGLALGILKLGVDAITSNKMTVELAFRHAWRRWARANSYLQVNAGPHRDDIYIQIIDRSMGRRFSYAIWRDERGKLYPDARMSWTVDESLAALAESSEVPVADWLELARLFLDEIGMDERFANEDGVD